MAAESYFAAVNDCDASRLAALFSEDAVLEHPGGTFVGRGAIVAFYRETVLALQTYLTATAMVQEGRRCVAEFEGRSPLGDDIVYACDVFEVDETGAVTNLHIYIR